MRCKPCSGDPRSPQPETGAGVWPAGAPWEAVAKGARQLARAWSEAALLRGCEGAACRPGGLSCPAACAARQASSRGSCGTRPFGNAPGGSAKEGEAASATQGCGRPTLSAGKSRGAHRGLLPSPRHAASPAEALGVLQVSLRALDRAQPPPQAQVTKGGGAPTRGRVLAFVVSGARVCERRETITRVTTGQLRRRACPFNRCIDERGSGRCNSSWRGFKSCPVQLPSSLKWLKVQALRPTLFMVTLELIGWLLQEGIETK